MCFEEHYTNQISQLRATCPYDIEELYSESGFLLYFCSWTSGFAVPRVYSIRPEVVSTQGAPAVQISMGV